MDTPRDQRDLTRRATLRGVAGIALGGVAVNAVTQTTGAQEATPSAFTGGATATTQVTVLTTEGAMAVLQAALAKAKEIGVPEVIAVLDADGIMKAYVRMNGSLNSSIDFAFDKAFTAASFHTPTDQFAKAVSGDPATMASLLKAPHVILLGGGVPLMSGDTLVGAIGCSGGSVEQDIECAQAGVSALSS
jgi:uncharacterized protein GlcG (DUF336 family)